MIHLVPGKIMWALEDEAWIDGRMGFEFNPIHEPVYKAKLSKRVS